VRRRGFERDDRRRQTESEARRRTALQPTVEFILAQRIVAALRAGGPLTTADLADGLGTVPGNETFAEATQLAERDHRIEPVPEASWTAVTAATLLTDDSLLRDTGYVDELVECIATIAAAEALFTHDELLERTRELAGAHHFKPRGFDAALEQAIEEHRLTWLGPDLFGVAVDELSDRGSGAQPAGNGDIAAAVKRVVAATPAVREALAGGPAAASSSMLADVSWPPADAEPIGPSTAYI
jgi:hypothetical protein